MVTAPKDRGCCWPISLNSTQTNLNYQKAPTKIFLPVCHARFLLNKLFICKKNLHQTAFYKTAIPLFACFSQLKINSGLSYGCTVFWVFFKAYAKSKSKTAIFKLFNIYLQECPRLHFHQGTKVSLGVGSVENWAGPLYQGQLTVIFDVSKGC